jgi:hypothetical protein
MKKWRPGLMGDTLSQDSADGIPVVRMLVRTYGWRELEYFNPVTGMVSCDYMVMLSLQV